MNWPTLFAKLQDKAIEWLLKALAPVIGLSFPLWEDRLTKLLQENLSPLWLTRLLVILLLLCLFLGTLLFLKRTKFIEYRGAFFKPKTGGGFHEAVYCGICKSPTARTSKVPFLDEPFVCKCGWKSNFNLGEFNVFFPTLKP